MHNLCFTENGPSMVPVALSKSLGASAQESNNADGVDSDSSESLLIAVGNWQDIAAYNKLFSRFASKIFAMGIKLTGNEQLANDLVQEAMLSIWQKAPLFDLDRGSAKSWIFTLSRNRCFDLLRKLKRQPSCVTSDDIWPQHEGEENTAIGREEIVSLVTQIAQIEKYCVQLPEQQQAVIEQIYIFDRTHEAAAEALKIPLGTLKSRLRLGLGKLRQLIGVEQ